MLRLAKYGVVCAWLGLMLTLAPEASAYTPEGIVFESEAIAQPQDAWLQDKTSPDHWMLWTREQAIDQKRSGGAVLASPPVAEDRDTPEAGAPPLHCVAAGLEPGTYLVYISHPGGRPLAYSLDGDAWFKHDGSELALGAKHLPEGRFECWVDDRYAHPATNPGPGYFDYIRFLPVPDSTRYVRLYDTYEGVESWAVEQGHGFTLSLGEALESGAIAARGFEIEGQSIKGGGQQGDQFTYTFDRAGTFYIGLIMNDDVDGIEQLSATVNGKEIGCAVGAKPRGGVGLHSFQHPIEVNQGGTLTFTCLRPVGYYRVQTLVLAAQPIAPPPPRFDHIEPWRPEPGAVDLCWTTSGVVETGRVEYGTAGNPQQTELDTYQGRNHRVMLRGLDPGQTYTARIITEFEGKPLVSAPVTFSAVPPRPPETQPQTIPLTAEEPTGTPRKAWPTTVGVPFAQGKLAQVEDLRLFNAQDQVLTLQAQCFSRWPDGSVKWATLSFLADAPAQYRLEARPSWPEAPPSQPDTLTLEDTGAAWHATTGTLAFDIGKEVPALFHHVAIDRDANGAITEDECIQAEPLGANLKLALEDGAATCGPPDTFEVQENGPVRAVLQWSGPLLTQTGETGWRYLVDTTLWRGSKALSLNVAVWNDQSKPGFRAFNALALRVPLDGAGAVHGALEGGPLQPVPDADGWWIHQDKDNHYTLRTAEGTAEGARAQGLAVAQDDHTRLTALIHDFWQTYPSGYAIKPDGIHIRLLPDLPEDAYTDDESSDWFYKLYAWCRDGKYLLRAGQMTRHQVTIHYGTPAGDASPETLAGWMAHPLLPKAGPAYLCATAALGRALFPQTAGVWDDYEDLFERGFEASQKDRQQRRTFGWMHYGDWFGERILNYGNSEYDMAWALAVQWMRTGARPYFDRGLQMARHLTSVDTIHGQPAEGLRGLVWEHCYNHVGSPFSPKELRFPPDAEDARKYMDEFGGMLDGAMDPQGHIFQEGNWLYAALTGDPWLRYSAARICTHQARTLTPNFNFTIERCGGWPLINAGAAYKFSGNPYYLNAARIMIERCLKRQDPETGGWLHTPPRGETGGVPVLGGKAFAVGILSYGILRYLDIEPQDRPDVHDMLVRGADWLMNESWIPGKGFRYISNCEKYRDSGRRGMTCLLDAEIIAFAYEQTQDPKYLAFWHEMMDGLMPTIGSGMGKAYTQAVRQTVFGLDRIRPWAVKTETAEGK